MDNQDQETDQQPKKLSLFQIVKSVLSAAFGVQSSKNKERDFTQGSHRTFIIAGIIFTLVFIGSVFTLVKIVLKSAGH